MLSRRLVVCLDVAGGKVVKGVQFESLKYMGDPAELAARYELQGADEVVLRSHHHARHRQEEAHAHRHAEGRHDRLAHAHDEVRQRDVA